MASPDLNDPVGGDGVRREAQSASGSHVGSISRKDDAGMTVEGDSGAEPHGKRGHAAERSRLLHAAPKPVSDQFILGHGSGRRLRDSDQRAVAEEPDASLNGGFGEAGFGGEIL